MEETKVMDSKTRQWAFFQKTTHGEEKISSNTSAAKAPGYRSPRQDKDGLKSMRHLENFRELWPSWNRG